MFGNMILIFGASKKVISKCCEFLTTYQINYETVIWNHGHSSVHRSINTNHLCKEINSKYFIPKNIILNANRYETGANSIFMTEKIEDTLIVSIEGVPESLPEVLFQKLVRVFTEKLLSSELFNSLSDVLQRESGSFSLIGYCRKGSSEIVFAFSNYRPIFLTQVDDTLLLTTVKDILLRFHEKIYEVSSNSLAVWMHKQQISPRSNETLVSTSSCKYSMIQEIYEIPYLLKRIYSFRYHPKMRVATKLIQESERIYVIGSGSSLNAGLEFQYLLPELNIIPISVFEFRMYKLAHIKEGDVIIAITQSGDTWSIVETVEESKKKGIRVISITNNPLSKVSKYSNVVLPILAGPELAIPATKSFTGTLAVLYSLSLNVRRELGLISNEESEELLHQLSTIADEIKNVLPNYEKKAKAVAKSIQKLNRGYIISAGLSYPIAIEGALKLKETAYSHAEALELEEYLHGPLALTSSEMYNILILPLEKAAKERLIQKIDKFYKDVGKLIVIGEIPELRETLESSENTVLVDIKQRNMPYIFHVTTFIQLLSFWLGIYRKTPVDNPKGLSKAVVG
jgi:glucosamine--fructose-6-phosphate aminotransferase (isomerizing)